MVSRMTASEIILYTHSMCSDSPKVRDWLLRRGIQFTERQIDKDADAAGDLQADTGDVVIPRVVAPAGVVTGFDPEMLEELVGPSS